MVLTLKDIMLARQRMGHFVSHTPLQHDYALGRRCNCNLYLKLENHQHTGSFKLRGALNRVATLPQAERSKGIVTASSGNHGLAVAYAAQIYGNVPATIFLPRTTPQAKLRKIEGFGVDIHLAEDSYESAHHAAIAFQQLHGMTYISAYDDPFIIAGQGTAGLEIMQDLPDAEIILVPIGGGGLSAGIALAAKSINPQVRVIGVQPEASPAALLSFQDGYAHEEYEAAPTIADGLAGGYGRLTFEIAKDLIDDIIIVKEADIYLAVATLLEFSQELVEGSGAIAIAPLLSGQLPVAGEKVVAVLSGRNIDAAVIHHILSEVYAARNPDDVQAYRNLGGNF